MNGHPVPDAHDKGTIFKVLDGKAQFNFQTVRKFPEREINKLARRLDVSDVQVAAAEFCLVPMVHHNYLKRSRF